MKPGRVAVIGAGVAGLTVARQLALRGWEAVVFDKARGVGGRTSTRRSESAEFDHGAQYFTCRTDAFSQQVEDWCGSGVAAVWDSPIDTLGGGARSAKREEARRYVGVPGMSALARDLAKGIRVECGTRIARIGGTPTRRILSAEDGTQFSGFDTVVVATPAPQAVPLLEPAPRLAAQVAGVEMQPCHAVLASFPTALGIGFGGAFVSEGPLAWVARTASRPGRPDSESWVLHAGSDWSARHLEEPAEGVAASLLGAFGDALGRELPASNSCSTHLWRFARATQPLGTPFLLDEEQRLAVCGDWTHGARVEDAYTSGVLLARAMLGEEPPPASPH